MGVAACKFLAVLLIAFLISCNVAVSSSRLLCIEEGISTSRVLLGARGGPGSNSGPGSNGGPGSNNDAPRNGFGSPHPTGPGPISDPNNWAELPPLGSIPKFLGPFPGPVARPWGHGFRP
ncbi:unnamed protein product [Calypogeia fissa]